MKVILTKREILVKFGLAEDTELEILELVPAESEKEWIDVPKNWDKPYCPTLMNVGDKIRVRYRNGNTEHGDNSDWYVSWVQEGQLWDIVAYQI